MMGITHKNFAKRAFIAFVMAFVVVLGGIAVTPKTAVAEAELSEALLTPKEPWGATLADALFANASSNTNDTQLEERTLANFPHGGYGTDHYGKKSASTRTEFHASDAGDKAVEVIKKLGANNVLDTSSSYSYDKQEAGDIDADADAVSLKIQALSNGCEAAGKSVVNGVVGVGKALNPYYFLGFGNGGDSGGSPFAKGVSDYFSQVLGLDAEGVKGVMRTMFMIVGGLFMLTIIWAFRNVRNAKRSIVKSKNYGLRALVILISIPLAATIVSLCDNAANTVHGFSDDAKLDNAAGMYIDVLEYAGNTNFNADDLSLLDNPTTENVKEFNKRMKDTSQNLPNVSENFDPGSLNPESMVRGHESGTKCSVNEYIAWVKNAVGANIAAAHWDGTFFPDGVVNAKASTGYSVTSVGAESGTNTTSSTAASVGSNPSSGNGYQQTGTGANSSNNDVNDDGGQHAAQVSLSDALFIALKDNVNPPNANEVKRKVHEDNDTSGTDKNYKLDLSTFGMEKQVVVLNTEEDACSVTRVNLYDPTTYCYGATKSGTQQHNSVYSYTWGSSGSENGMGHQLINPVLGKALEPYKKGTTTPAAQTGGEQTIDMASEQVNNLWYANAAKIAMINARAGWDKNCFTTQSTIFLLQMTTKNGDSNTGGWTYRGVNLPMIGSGDKNVADNSGDNTGNWFYRYVMPENNHGATTGFFYKSSVAIFAAVAAGWSAILAAFAFVTTPLIGNLIKCVRGFFRGLFRGDVFGLLEFGVYYMTLTLTCIFVDLAISAGRIVVMAFSGLMEPMGNFAVGWGEMSDGIKKIPIVGEALGDVVSGYAASVFFILISVVVVVILTWPVMTITVGNKNKTVGVVAYVINLPTILANVLTERFGQLRQALYGTRSGGRGNLLGRGVGFKDGLKKQGGRLVKGAVTAGAVATGVGAIGAAAGAGAGVAGGLMGAGAGVPTALAHGASTFGKLGANAIGSTYNALSNIKRSNPQSGIIGGIVGLQDNFDKGKTALKNDLAKSLEKQASGAAYNAAALSINDPTGAGVNEVGTNGKSIDAKIKPNNHETDASTREDDVADLTDSGDETDSPMNGARSSAGVISGEGSAAEIASDISGQTTGHELNEQKVAVDENGSRLRLVPPITANGDGSGTTEVGGGTVNVNGGTVNVNNATLATDGDGSGGSPLSRLNGATVAAAENKAALAAEAATRDAAKAATQDAAAAADATKATAAAAVEGAAAQAAGNLQYERRGSYLQALHDHKAVIDARRESLVNEYRNDDLAPTDGSALERLAFSVRDKHDARQDARAQLRTERTERVEHLKETVREIHEHNTDFDRHVHNREVVDAYKADALAGMRAKYQAEPEPTKRGGRGEASKLSREDAQVLADAISANQAESRERRIDEQRVAFEQAMRNQKGREK